MKFRLIAGAAAVVLAMSSVPAQAVSVRDIIELSRAGLGDEVLVALIEVDGGILALDADQLRELKAAGVSERVMLAMLRSGRPASPDRPPMAPVFTTQPGPPPQVVVIDHHTETAPVVVPPVFFPAPVFVPVHTPVFSSVPQVIDVTRQRVPGRLINDGFRPIEIVRPVRTQPPPAEPVYWGFGGKLRPGAWDPN